MCMYVVSFCKIDHCIHIHWCIVMGLRHNDPWVESHMWLQQTWGQRSSRGQWPLVQVFGKKGQCIHILWCIFKSNITMIAKVCDRESRWDTWFENHLVSVRCSVGPAEGPGKILKYRSNLRLYPVNFGNKLCILIFIILSIWPNFFDPPPFTKENFLIPPPFW